jgi:hypothetical protein
MRNQRANQAVIKRGRVVEILVIVRSSPSQKKISLNDKLALYLNDALSVENSDLEYTTTF